MKKIAYLTNQYPKVSHTFIRREIQALEDEGLEVERYSVRRTVDDLADPADRAEATKTKVVLDGGAARLAARSREIRPPPPWVGSLVPRLARSKWG